MDDKTKKLINSLKNYKRSLLSNKRELEHDISVAQKLDFNTEIISLRNNSNLIRNVIDNIETIIDEFEN